MFSRKRGKDTHVPRALFAEGNMVSISLEHQVSLIAQLVKNSPAVQETPVQFLGQEDPLEKG